MYVFIMLKTRTECTITRGSNL